MAVQEDAPVFNPYSDLNRFRREAFRRVPGVVNTSEHMLRTGGRKTYYIDFDPLINDPIECRTIVSWYVETIRAILADHRIDGLAFLEKDRDSGGTTGAIRLAAAISMETRLPNITVRLGKELPEERIKFRSGLPTPIHLTLEGLRFAVLTDHTTTGSEGLRAVEAIEFRSGVVTDFIAYSLIKHDEQGRPEFRFDLFKAKEPVPINVHYFLGAPEDLVTVGLEVAHR